MYIKVRESVGEIKDWISFGLECYKKNFKIATAWGAVFAIFAYGLGYFVSESGNVDIAIPLIAMIVLVMGPLLALSMFGIAKQYQKYKKEPSGSIMNHRVTLKELRYSAMLSVILSVIMIFYMKGVTIIYALTTATFIAAPLAMEMTLISVPLPTEVTLEYMGANFILVILFVLWTIMMGWLAFIISWFSFPMVMDITANPVVAILSSLKAANKQKFLLALWSVVVGTLIILALMTPYFIGLVVVTPLLAFSTWAAYEYVIVHVVELRGVEKHDYKTITH
jgi:uncharacterized membrane protein